MKPYIKILLLLLSILIVSRKGFSQQEAQYSMYFFNPLLINPGYAGSQEALTVTAIVREQWTNFDGAPKTQGLSIHSPIKVQNIGLGFTVINDKIGATKNTGLYGNFAYSIKLNKKNHRLSFGLKTGIDLYRTNFSKSIVNDNTDNLYLDGSSYSKTLINLGVGIYYYGSRFYIGISSPAILKNQLNLPGGQNAVQENHYYAFGGIVLKLNAAINMRPSFVVKYVNNAPLSIDCNLSFLFYDKIWIGAMYRYNSAIGANILYNISQNFKIGYAYDYGLNAIQKYSAGSHEIVLSYNFKSRNMGFKSPRYF